MGGQPLEGHRLVSIRTGIIGYGLSGQVFHEPFLRTNPAFSLEVVATGNPERAARASVPVVSSPEHLLERAGSLDLIVLASPAHVHRNQAIAAMEAGCAVVIDKPFAASVAEAEDIIAASERTGRPLIVFQNRRWDSDFLTVKRLIADGALGEVHRFESTFERWGGALRPRWQDTTSTGQGAGISYDLGSHLVDQALHLFGPATLETAEMRIVREGGASEDDAFFSLLHDSGVRSHITVSRVAGQSGPRFRVLGTGAAYTVYGLDNQEPSLKNHVWPGDVGYGETQESDWGVIGVGNDLTAVPSEPGDYPAFYAGVAATILEGAAPPVAPAEALATLRILEQAHTITGI